MMKLKSVSFSLMGLIPKRFSGEGEDISPEFQWSEVPEGAKSFALICEDPDAPVGPGKDHPFIHWVVYNIPENITYLPEGLIQAERVQLPVFVDQGKNSFGKIGYSGPMPPEGHGMHHYHFTLFALDTAPGVPPGLTKAKLMKFIKPHIIAIAEAVGLYERMDRAPIFPKAAAQFESAPMTRH